MTRTPGRWLQLARGMWGLALVTFPCPLLGRLGGSPPDGRSVAVARVLGARQLLQAVVCGLVPSTSVLEAGVVVDLLHGCTGLALAALDRDRVRPALADAGVAGGLALLGALSVRPAGRAR